MESLAKFLNVPDPSPNERPVSLHLEDIAGDASAFCKAVLNSREFRNYIINGLTLGNIPSAIMLRVMDMAGWQKPPERVEHSGRVDSVTEVRRVIIHVAEEAAEDFHEAAAKVTVTH